MLQKLSQFIALVVTAITLVILLVFLGQQPDFDTYAKHDDMIQIVQTVEKNLDKKVGSIENLNGIDALNEKYTALEEENKALRTELEELKKKLNKTPEKPKVETPKQEPKKEPEVLKNETVTVAVDHLNFRNHASLSAPIRHLLEKGTKLEVLEKTVIEKDGYKWVKVGLKDGEVGYVAREYVKQ